MICCSGGGLCNSKLLILFENVVVRYRVGRLLRLFVYIMSGLSGYC